jgi:hypothetical protein
MTLVVCFRAGRAFALNPRKKLTQYTRTTWTQEQGLPQDTIRIHAPRCVILEGRKFPIMETPPETPVDEEAG